jgi:hypothetical protein
MGGLPGLNSYVHYIEYSLYGGSLYRGTTVLVTFDTHSKYDFAKMLFNIDFNNISIILIE